MVTVGIASGIPRAVTAWFLDARLTIHGRRLLITRVVDQGRPVAHVVKELGCSRATGYKWLQRWRAEGDTGLIDRSSRAHKTPAELEARVCQLRQDRKLGARLGPLSFTDRGVTRT